MPTVPVEATPRASTTVAVPADCAVLSPAFARRPPQLLTYAVFPSGESTTPNGATPTGTSPVIFDDSRSTMPSVLLIESAAYAVFSSGDSAIPHGYDPRFFFSVFACAPS